MDARRISGHIIVWGLAGFGAYLAFSFFPRGFVFPRNAFMSLLIVPAAYYWLYRLLGLKRVRGESAGGVFSFSGLAQDYSLTRHPVCVADVLLAWGIFFFYPDLRVLISVIWISIIVSFWLRMERNALFGPEKNNWKEDDITP